MRKSPSRAIECMVMQCKCHAMRIIDSMIIFTEAFVSSMIRSPMQCAITNCSLRVTRSAMQQDKPWIVIHICHVLLGLVLFIIQSSALSYLPIYRPWQTILPILFALLVVAGWLPVRRSRRNGASLRRFPYCLLLVLLWRRIRKRGRRPPLGTYWRLPIIRQRWALVILKSFYLPLMVGSLYYGFIATFRMSALALSFPMTLLFIRRFVFIFDSLIATAGYTVESRRWGSPIKAVETNVWGWLLCLACYPPVNGIPGLVLGQKRGPQYLLFPVDSLMGHICEIMAVLFIILFVISVATQGIRFANLTYRGTISHGMFSRIRHPQYATKLIGWFFEWLPFFGSPLNILRYLGWVGIYVGRTLTEERFLSRFEDYRAYRKRVRWRMIPGIW